MVLRSLLITLMLCATAVAAAPYKWVDKDGNVHYSDTPPPKDVQSQAVTLPPLTQIESQPIPEADMSPEQASEHSKEVAAASGAYTAMRIAKPADQDTIRGGGVTISAELEPSLHDGDTIQYFLDGAETPASVPYLERGEHKISARVVGPDGYEKIAATPITVFVHQPTVQQTQPKPPPKPKKP